MVLSTEAPVVGVGAWSWVTAKLYKQPQGVGRAGGGSGDQHQVEKEERKPERQGGKPSPGVYAVCMCVFAC